MKLSNIAASLACSLFIAGFSMQALPALANISTPAEKWMDQYETCLKRADPDVVISKIKGPPPHADAWDTLHVQELMTTLIEQKKSKIMSDTDYYIEAVANNKIPNVYFVEESGNEWGIEMLILSPTAPLGKNLTKRSFPMQTKLGIHLGSTKKQVRTLLGKGIVSVGCDSESWTYPAGDNGMNPSVMVYVFRAGKVVKIAEKRA